MTIKKLTAMPYAQAHIEIDNDYNISLFSYVTLVATITKEGWLTVYGLYSMTARKHISAFMKEYGGYAFLLFGNVLPVVFAFTFSKGATKNAIPAN